MPNIGGPSASKRKLLGTVVSSKLLYASASWAEVATRTARNRESMCRAQIQVALRIIRAYWTVSTDGALFLASIIPADLKALERKRVADRIDEQGREDSVAMIKLQERSITVGAWQARWDGLKNSRWTHTLLPSVYRWMRRPVFPLTYHMTQALTENGCFRQYLNCMNRSPDASCCYCSFAEDTAEHMIFVCP
ncbi:uncharacterized protein LOC112680012 [Sipha flava]|uniref:Uncharacterized protein LOC112680012 n=1 Tax=Sipha flava TaxID=143950 RepID=A0A8B8F4Z8_9HEMI|nr:uncharacterized protein LOC112680012 [Sipha flava]